MGRLARQGPALLPQIRRSRGAPRFAPGVRERLGRGRRDPDRSRAIIVAPPREPRRDSERSTIGRRAPSLQWAELSRSSDARAIPVRQGSLPPGDLRGVRSNGITPAISRLESTLAARFVGVPSKRGERDKARLAAEGTANGESRFTNCAPCTGARRERLSTGLRLRDIDAP